jgi:large subunit ribosomal protein L19e
MIMDTSYQKRLASKILKCSPKRVSVSQDKDIEEALTRSDVKHLIVKGLIKKKQKKGTTRTEANRRLIQKKKGRSSGKGKKKGTKYALMPKKDMWIRTIRAQRKLLKELKERGQVDTETYRLLYRRSKGGEFRNKKHMLSYMSDNGMLKGSKRDGVTDAKD